ncbi:MAG: MFS transporter [Acidimicrobiales bacterium]
MRRLDDSGQAAVARPAGRWRDLVVVGWSHAGQHAYMAGLGVAIPFVVAAFHVSYAEMGVVLAVAAMLGSALQLLAVVFRRVSTRLLLVGQDAGSMLGAALAALAPGIGVFAAGRFLQAITGWPQHPVGSAYLSNSYPEHRGSVLSWHITAGNVGTLIAPLAVSSVIAAGGWQWGFGLLAILLATTVAVVAFGLHVPWHSIPRMPSGVDGAGRHEDDSDGSRIGLIGLLRQRPVATLLLAGTIAAGGQGIGILGVYAPAYLKSGLGFSALSLGLILTVVYLGAVIGPVLMGTFADRISHRLVLLGNYGLGAVALLGFAFVGKSILALGAVGLFMGIFSYSELSLRQTLFADYVGQESVRAAFGVFFAVSQAVGALWVAVIGVVVTDIDFHAAFVTMAGTFVLAGLLVALGTARSRRASLTV